MTIMLKIAEFTQRSNVLLEKVQKAFSEAGIVFSYKKQETDSVKLVFAGQYSAGKSSILKMLTGRKDIVIGEGITTQQTHTYDWNGIEVVDTPGIHTELRPDHDEISYAAIAAADMLIYVITNELFDSFNAAHFRKLAIDKDKAGEMILVVNKMEREEAGNSVATRDIKREDLKKVLEPYTPEQLHLTFLDAESYLDSIAETDAETAEALVERSGYREFVKTLNHFVNKKHIPSKLTTNLYLIDEQLEKTIKDLQPNSSDSDIDALEESFRQQRYRLIEGRGQMQQEVKDIFTEASSKIRNIGLEAANLLVVGCKKDEVENELNNNIGQVNIIIDDCQRKAVQVINNRLNEMGKDLEDIEESEFTRNLKSRIEGKLDKLPKEIQEKIKKTGTAFQQVGKKVIDSSYKEGIQGGLELTNFSGSAVHQMVLKTGSTIGYKFKPWEAIKITRKIAVGGQVLSVLGVGLSIFMQIKSDQEDEQLRENLKCNRQNIRSQFNVVASDLEDFAKQFINSHVNRPLDNSIKTLDDNIQGIRESRNNRSSLCCHLEDLQKECQQLINDIHTAEL